MEDERDTGKMRSGRKAALGVPDETATVESGVKPPKATPGGDERAEPSPARVASPTPTLPASGSTTIVSLWPGRLKVVCPSGAVYIWERSGEHRHVAAEDVEHVMGRNSDRRACCGGSSARTYFALAE